MGFIDLFGRLGQEVEDHEEETFLLFSRDIPSQNLGFVDAQATEIELSIAGKEYVVTQSPAVLTSNRGGGTTGAVLWKITPLVAEYLADDKNILRQTGVISSGSVVIELGCGVSGLIGLVVGPTLQQYVLTDQSYVARFVEKNISENKAVMRPAASKKKKSKQALVPTLENVVFKALDWELDEVTAGLTGLDHIRSFDVVIACDCIYNEALIEPLVRACVDVCTLREKDRETDNSQATPSLPSTLCIVGQQLRDPDIFDGWIKEFHKYFRTWRLPDEVLSPTLQSSPGFVLHCGVLRESSLS